MEIKIFDEPDWERAIRNVDVTANKNLVMLEVSIEQSGSYLSSSHLGSDFILDEKNLNYFEFQIFYFNIQVIRI